MAARLDIRRISTMVFTVFYHNTRINMVGYSSVSISNTVGDGSLAEANNIMSVLKKDVARVNNWPLEDFTITSMFRW